MPPAGEAYRSPTLALAADAHRPHRTGWGRTPALGRACAAGRRGAVRQAGAVLPGRAAPSVEHRSGAIGRRLLRRAAEPGEVSARLREEPGPAVGPGARTPRGAAPDEFCAAERKPRAKRR
ncbi:hypothetical protein GCM10027440_44130 [Nocardiopsis coralliicola]